jgi:hypothetical protein
MIRKIAYLSRVRRWLLAALAVRPNPFTCDYVKDLAGDANDGAARLARNVFDDFGKSARCTIPGSVISVSTLMIAVSTALLKSIPWLENHLPCDNQAILAPDPPDILSSTAPERTSSSRGGWANYK